MDVLLAAIVMIFGCGWVARLGWERFQKKKRCREPITGVCKKVTSLKSSPNCYYRAARFCYTYKGKKYEYYAVDQMKRKISDRFEVGKSYPLYINPDKPENIRCTKKVIRAEDWFCILVFGFFHVEGIIGAIVWIIQVLVTGTFPEIK